MADDTTTSSSTTTNLGIELINGSDYISPDPINNGFTTLDKLGVDYVTETGKSGDWWYRKWHSGRAECGVDSKTFETKKATEWGSGWGLAGKYTFGAYPFSFASEPTTLIQFRHEDGNSSGAMIHIHPNSSTSKLSVSPSFSLADANMPRTYTNPVCSIYVTGTVSTS
jgi:hypothetical protein